MPIPFHPLELADKEAIKKMVHDSACRNCDLNFMNLFSWRFLYDTEVAVYKHWLLFRFKADGHNAYMAPVGNGDWRDIVTEMQTDAKALGHPFLMLGVCDTPVACLEEAMPGYFYAKADRNFSDYIYLRESLATLAGKKMQAKRNFANRFARLYPDYRFEPLQPSHFGECMELALRWTSEKHTPAEPSRYTWQAERQSIQTVFDHWDALDGQGGTIWIGNRLAAFTYGAPVNHDTFDICAEKADAAYEGIYATLCRDFARSIPPAYTYINREEDLGIDGLRQSKLSYHPYMLLHKYTVMTKHPMGAVPKPDSSLSFP